jgi:hypothetical protein
MSLTKLSRDGNTPIIPRLGRVWLVTSRLGTGKQLTFFYSVSFTCKKSVQYNTHALGEKKEPTTDTDNQTANNRHPRPDNQKLTTTSDSDSDTRQSTVSNRQPTHYTTTNKQLPPTDTPDKQNKHSTTEMGKMKMYTNSRKSSRY